MKQLRIFIFILAVMATSCDDRGHQFIEDENPPVPCRAIITKAACGFKDVGNELQWLNELIVASFNDTSGRLEGKIWLKTLGNVDYFITDMPIADGFNGYHVFNCDGEELANFDGLLLQSLTNKYVLWISECPKPGTTD